MPEYKHILFCTDLTWDSEGAFGRALDLASEHGARLHVLHVPHSSYRSYKHVVDEHLPDQAGNEAFYDEALEQRALATVAQAYGHRMAGHANHVFVVRCGAVEWETSRYARKNGVDVVVVADRHRCDGECDGGSVAEAMRRTLSCPLEVVAARAAAHA